MIVIKQHLPTRTQDLTDAMLDNVFMRFGSKVGVALLLDSGDLIGHGYRYPGAAFNWADRWFRSGRASRAYLYDGDTQFWRFSPEQGWEAS